MSPDTSVRGDPAACRQAAHRLRSLALLLADAAVTLVRQSHVPERDFGGLSGDSFRAHAAGLARSADDTAVRCGALAGGLDALAGDLEDVRRLMAQARESLLLDGLETVARARRLEARAQEDWRQVLLRYADLAPCLPPFIGPVVPPSAGPVSGPDAGTDSDSDAPGPPVQTATPPPGPAHPAAHPAAQAAGHGPPPAPSYAWEEPDEPEDMAFAPAPVPRCGGPGHQFGLTRTGQMDHRPV